MSNISIIIPYYQKKPGILRRAIDSIALQKLDDNVNIEILIVDDESPIPAEAEVDGINFTNCIKPKIIKQKNAGVSGARNTGIANISDNTEIVLFMDSDDFWHPNKIQSSINALKNGADFFFCDHERLGSYDSIMKNAFFEGGYSIKDIGNNNFEIEKEDLINCNLNYFITHASTVAFKKALLEGLIFNINIKNAGEDILFFTELIARANKIIFTKEKLVTCADGINIFFNEYTNWDSPSRLLIARDRFISFWYVLKIKNLSSENKQMIRKTYFNFGFDYAFFIIRKFVKNRKVPDELISLLRESPKQIPDVIFFFSTVGFAKLFGIYKPN
ncbi:glycosyltransferase family 2 protein [Pseudaquidulcibacter saccharophilus]|uniref:glycosyltransferase family 2 protein n=1 Tax=Pseudaquidulcibacter saccharophilus TaxID=2831900 RepID=UPI001EFF45B8|nr:glycosyltransferase family 2 protein [Pseudaquidulcibacter saccharophilus]